MKYLLVSVALLGACGAGDDTTEGARGACSRGGVLEACSPIAHTPQAACSRLVQCGAIPELAPQDYQFDWDRCVDYIDRLSPTAGDLVITCIASSTCDLLRVDNPNSPDPRQMPCLQLGGGL